ncbi:MAG: hypothetical protein WCI11_09095 [Candidatus Methylumidiphilus sp.]
MQEIYVLKSGESFPANISRLFETHGPYTIEGHRLDLLTKVQVLVDSSTSTIKSTGESTSEANTGSMLGRAVVGGVLLGGSGVITGGLSGKRESNTKTISSESLNTEITAELIFLDGISIYVVIRSIESFHWLLSFAGQPSLTDDELEIEKNKAEKEAELKELQRKIELEGLQNKSLEQNKQAYEDSPAFLLIVAFGVVFFIAIFIFTYRAWESYSSNNPSQVLPIVLEQTASLVPDIEEDDLNKYFANFVKSTENNIHSPELTKTTANTYVVEFKTSDKSFMADKNGDKDPEAFNNNQSLVSRWETIFCTPELKSIISNHNILYVTGYIYFIKNKNSPNVYDKDLKPSVICSGR